MNPLPTIDLRKALLPTVLLVLALLVIAYFLHLWLHTGLLAAFAYTTVGTVLAITAISLVFHAATSRHHMTGLAAACTPGSSPKQLARSMQRELERFGSTTQRTERGITAIACRTRASGWSFGEWIVVVISEESVCILAWYVTPTMTPWICRSRVRAVVDGSLLQPVRRTNRREARSVVAQLKSMGVLEVRNGVVQPSWIP
jgi:hypothetical protein